MEKSARIVITGASGLVGIALVEVLRRAGFANVVGVSSRDCDLRVDSEVAKLLKHTEPEYVFHLAARVYGIGGNQRYKSDVLYENVLINTNVVEHARRSGVKKIVAMGSGCVYPALPDVEELREEHVWMGPPHPSEDSYAHAKRLMLAHLMAAQEQYGLRWAFAISGNLYGPHDSFDVEHGHVTPALVAKFFHAKRNGTTVHVWGSGVAIRDFSYSEDAAEALLTVMRAAEGPINLCSGYRHRISDIVRALEAVTGNTVPVEWDRSKPDGQLRRYFDTSRLRQLGFTPRVPLTDGIRRTYAWFEDTWPNVRGQQAH